MPSVVVTWATSIATSVIGRWRPVRAFASLIDVHRGPKIAEPQRERVVELYLRAADLAGLLAA